MDRVIHKCGNLFPGAATALTEDQQAEILVDLLASQLLSAFGIGNCSNAAETTDAAFDANRKLEQSYSDHVNRNRDLARALGACECWGELMSCRLCGGRGAPGFQPPDASLFNYFVRPVLHRVRQHPLRAFSTRHAAGARF